MSAQRKLIFTLLARSSASSLQIGCRSFPSRAISAGAALCLRIFSRNRPTPNINSALARGADELRDTLFRTLSDLRAGRITALEVKAATTALPKAIFGLR